MPPRRKNWEKLKPTVTVQEFTELMREVVAVPPERIKAALEAEKKERRSAKAPAHQPRS